MMKNLKIFMLAVILFIGLSCLAEAEASRGCKGGFADLECHLSRAFKTEEIKYPYKDFTPFKMVFLPDINLSFKDKDGEILYKESLVILQDVLKTLNQEENLDFVVFGGDLTDNADGKFSDIPMFLDTVSELKAKYYAIIGDREAHLADGFSKENFTKEFDEFDNKTLDQTFWEVEPVKNVLLIGLDTSIKNEENGYLNLHQLFWLDNILKNNRDKFTIIVMHHPPLITTEIDKNKWQKYTLQKPDLFRQLINLYPQVKIVLSGHHHCNYVKKINEKLFMTQPSIVEYPNSFNILKIYPDRVEVKNKKISFKQIIKEARKKLINSDYAKEFNSKNPKSVLKYNRGDKFSRQKEYYFGEQKHHFLWF